MNNISTSALKDVASISDLKPILGNIISYLLGFAGLALFLLLLVGGFKYITSGGDPKSIEGAKKTVTSAIAGLIIILASYLIFLLISKITGVEVTNFEIMILN